MGIKWTVRSSLTGEINVYLIVCNTDFKKLCYHRQKAKAKHKESGPAFRSLEKVKLSSEERGESDLLRVVQGAKDKVGNIRVSMA